MKRLSLVCLLSVALLRSAGAEPTVAEAGPPLKDPAHDPAWTDLFAHLAPDRTRFAPFVERRFFPFHKNPIVLTGEIRIVPGRGLSLHYLTPESTVMIVDREGLLLRDAQGRSRAGPSSGPAQAATNALIEVLQFDLPQLQKSFVLHGRRTADSWSLTFVPRDATLAHTLASLVVSGEKAKP